MSNKHTHCTNFITDFLEDKPSCSHRGCKGTLVKVYVRYEDHGPIIEELECSTCGKIAKRQKFRPKQRRRY